MYSLVRDVEEFNATIKNLNTCLPIFCDTETTEDEGKTSGGLYGKVRLFQLYQTCWDKALLVDCFFVPLEVVLDAIKPSTTVWHGGAYDLHTINLYTKDTWLPKEVEDTLYLSRLAYPTKMKFTFYDCLEYARLNDELIDSIDKKEQQKSNWSGALSIKQKTYAAADVLYLSQLYAAIKEKKDKEVYQLDIDNLKFAVKYSRNGLPVNQETVTKLKKEYIDKLEDTLDTLPINPRSSKQACEYLGTNSSNEETLLDLIHDGNKKAEKIKNARHYLKSLEYLNRYDRPKIKGFFQPCASISGRFSCTGGNSFDHANLQQVPYDLHKAIEAPEGHELIYKDYAGIELRMAVAYTGEPTMLSMYLSGDDLHTETAKYIFNIEEVTKKQRDLAKTFNFGLIYGAGVKTIQIRLRTVANIDMTFNEVKALIQKWFSRYSWFKEWHNIHGKYLRVHGYVDIETALGRKVRAYKYTDSLNLPIQGSTAEVQKVALSLLNSRYPDNHLLDTIHDSNILLSKTEDVEVWGTRLNEVMVEAWYYVIQELAVPDLPMPDGYEHGKVWEF